LRAQAGFYRQGQLNSFYLVRVCKSFELAGFA